MIDLRTNSAEAPPLPPQQVPQGPRRPSWPTAIAWLVILLCTAAMSFRPAWLDRSPGSPDAPPLPAALADTPSTQLEMVSRYVVGAKALAGEASPQGADLAAQIEPFARSPIDAIRAVAVIAELSGRQKALERLDDLEQKHPLVHLRPDADALRTIYTGGPADLTAEQRDRLIENHGWFGRLALSHGLPVGDPHRAAALGPASRAVVLGAMFAFLGLGAAFSGLILLVLGIVLFVQRKLVPVFRPPASNVAGPLVEAFALYLFGMVALSQILGRLFPDAGLPLTFVLFALLPLALVYLRLRGLDWRAIADGLGLHRGRGFWREIGVGFVGYLAGLPVLAAGLGITVLLTKLSGTTPSHPVSGAPMGEPGQVLMLFLLAAVGAPIVEEIFFRGALLGHLRSRLPWWLAALIVSLIFAAIHPQGWVAIPVLTALAMVFSALREWRGSIIAPVVAHAMNNGMIVLLMASMLA